MYKPQLVLPPSLCLEPPAALPQLLQGLQGWHREKVMHAAMLCCASVLLQFFQLQTLAE
jgi:hypothetical protein